MAAAFELTTKVKISFTLCKKNNGIILQIGKQLVVMFCL
jgi:hypothetical protein